METKLHNGYEMAKFGDDFEVVYDPEDNRIEIYAGGKRVYIESDGQHYSDNCDGSLWDEPDYELPPNHPQTQWDTKDA